MSGAKEGRKPDPDSLRPALRELVRKAGLHGAVLVSFYEGGDGPRVGVNASGRNAAWGAATDRLSGMMLRRIDDGDFDGATDAALPRSYRHRVVLTPRAVEVALRLCSVIDEMEAELGLTGGQVAEAAAIFAGLRAVFDAKAGKIEEAFLVQHLVLDAVLAQRHSLRRPDLRGGAGHA